jgi:hypothetical protein
MKKSEFKKILKPLIKEAVKEVLFEPGVLSRVITEVASSMPQSPIVEAKEQEDLAEKQRIYENQRQEKIKRLNESANLKTSVFDGVSDMPEKSSGALTGVPPADAGVDISGITRLAGGASKWKSLIGK